MVHQYSDEEITSSEDEYDQDQVEHVHSRLLSAIDRFVEQGKSSSDKSSLSSQNTTQLGPENFFDGSNQASLSMDALIGALGNSKSMSSVVKHLSDLEKNLSAPKYVEKVAASRMERKEVYSASKDDMGKWQEIVSHNRHVKSLDLAQDKHQVASYKGLIAKYQPMNELENEIQMVLVKSGGTDKEAEKREIDELGARSLSMEEIRQKQADLAKVKARMFYDQQKRHRINKIKSKAYHRIRKRQKQRKEKNGVSADDSDEDGMDGDDPESEQLSLQRIQERMSLRHKNTGKWAKMAMEMGKKDGSVRAAYHESIKLGQDLLKKVHEDPLSKGSHESDDEDDYDDDDDDDDEKDEEMESGEEDDSENENHTSKRVARALDASLKKKDSSHMGKYQKLYEMDFMKRAEEAQQHRLREEAKAILREIEEMENVEDHDEDDEHNEENEKEEKDSTSDKYDMKNGKKNVENKDISLEVSNGPGLKILPSRKKKSSSMSMPLSTESKVEMEESKESNPWLSLLSSASMSAGVTQMKEAASNEPESLQSSTTTSTTDQDNMNIHVNKGNKKRTVEKIAVRNDSKNGNSSNSNEGSSKNIHNLSKKTTKMSKEGSTVDGIESSKDNNSNMSTIHDIENSTLKSTAKSSQSSSKISHDIKPAGAHSERRPLLAQKSQADMVQMAFAGPDFESEFSDWKSHEISDELGFEAKRKEVSSQLKAGWGDWAGPGAMLVSAKIQRKRDREIKKIEEEEAVKMAQRKDKKMPNVIISERKVKSTSKYMIGDLPHPFTTREQYEASLQVPLGEEWNATQVYRKNTKPEILIRSGRIINPIALKGGSKKRKEEGNAVEGKKKARMIQ